MSAGGGLPSRALSLEERVLLALPWVGASAALVVAPSVVGPFLGNEWVRMLSVAWIYVILAVGLWIVVGKAGLIDLGYVAFFGLGAYFAALLGSAEIGVSLSFWLLLPLSALLSGLLAFGLGKLLSGVRGELFAVVTLALGAAASGAIQVLDLALGGTRGISGIFPPSVAGFSLGEGGPLLGMELPAPYRVYYFTLALALASLAVARFAAGRFGAGERALTGAEKETAGTDRPGGGSAWGALRMYTLAGCLGGAAGAVFAGAQGLVDPANFVLWQAFLVLGMIFLGGKGHPWGAALGALIVVAAGFVLEQQGNYVQRLVFGGIKVDPNNLRFLLIGLVLVLVPLFWREGLWPARGNRNASSG